MVLFEKNKVIWRKVLKLLFFYDTISLETRGGQYERKENAYYN